MRCEIFYPKLGTLFLTLLFIGGTLFNATANVPFLLDEEAPLQQQITGQVTDETGVPLVGVNVLAKGTDVGTITDVNGAYQISVPDEVTVLIFSYVGYEPTEVNIAGRRVIDVALSGTVALDEVVVIGYGKVKKSDLTGSVSSVGSEEIVQVPVVNLNSALQGQTAGVQVSQASGAPGSSPIIRIRGANSLTAGNSPLYVVDGVLLSGDIGSELNINDIESVEVLKDASATAIYGSRGANGVVVITTKRGRSGEGRVSYDTYFSFQDPIEKVALLNAEDFKTLHREAFTATGAPTSDAILNSTSNTDWQEELFRTALQQNHQLSFSGGTETARFYLSGNYLGQEGVIDNTNLDRFSFRFNGDLQVNDRLSITNSITFSNTNSNRVNEDALSNAALWAPPTLPILNEDGEYTLVEQPFPRTNPIGLRDAVLNERIFKRLIGNLGLNLKIANGFTAEANFGVDQSLISDRNFVPTGIMGTGDPGSARRGEINDFSWVTDFLLRYDRQFQNHSIQAVVGATAQAFTADVTESSAQGFPNESLTFNGLQTGAIQNVFSNLEESSLVSFLARVNYIFQDKYLVTFSSRYDGSSRLAKDNRFDFFPSVALAWKLGQEEFIQNLGLFSDLKLRASLGWTGNQAIAPFSTLARLRTVSYLLDNDRAIGVVPSSLPNENLGWERTRQLDVGLDVGLFSGRVQFSIDYYKKNTTDLLLNIDVPASSGLITQFGDIVTRNVGEVENKGFDFQLSAKVLTGAFSWTASPNLSINRSEVIGLGLGGDGQPIDALFTDQSFGSALIVQVGESPYQPYGRVATGINENGEFEFADLDNNGAIDDLDRTIVGDLEPNFIFGFNNRFQYQNFDLSLLLVGSVGNDVLVQALGASYALNGQFNIFQSVFDARGETTPTPRSDRPGSQNLNSRFIRDGTFVKFRDITLGYNLPARLAQKISFDRLRFYVSGQNLINLTSDDYPLFDPEMSSSGTIPGVDRGGYPTVKSFTLGLNASF